MQLPRPAETELLLARGHNNGFDEDELRGVHAEPEVLLQEENLEWDHIPNLDAFFMRLYTYFAEKGYWCIVASRVLNLLTLAFTIFFSGFLLLYVNWTALNECRRPRHEGECDVLKVGLYSRPLQERSRLGASLVVVYLVLFSVALAWTALRFALELGPLQEMRRFVNGKLGVSERDMRTITWPELVSRVVAVQHTTRLCIVKDLSAHDIVTRIARKENYLVGMLNKGALDLTAPALWPLGLGKRVWLTKAVEWNLYWCVLDAMFDDHFLIRADFADERLLRRRFRTMAVANALLSPFLAVFMLLFFFLRNAERLYHHPSAVGARRWSPVARWLIRQLNELPHDLDRRLAASRAPAERYCNQFPSPVVSLVAKFVAFVVGAFAAALLALALVDERLLEAVLWGRNLLWYTALCGSLLAVSRALISDGDADGGGGTGQQYEPEAAMAEVVRHTQYFPKRWANAVHTPAVQREFQHLFQFQALLFCEEMLSVLIAPLLLWHSLPKSASKIIAFVREFTAHVEGVGHVCSLAAFDFARHGNARYGSVHHAPRQHRSEQGKMEKSFLTFAETYPDWEPDADGQAMLVSVSHLATLTRGGVGGGAAASVLMRSQQQPGAAAAAAQQQQQQRADTGAAAGTSGATAGGPPLGASRGPLPSAQHPQQQQPPLSASAAGWDGFGLGASASQFQPGASAWGGTARGGGAGGRLRASVSDLLTSDLELAASVQLPRTDAARSAALARLTGRPAPGVAGAGTAGGVPLQRPLWRGGAAAGGGASSAYLSGGGGRAAPPSTSPFDAAPTGDAAGRGATTARGPAAGLHSDLLTPPGRARVLPGNPQLQSLASWGAGAGDGGAAVPQQQQGGARAGGSGMGVRRSSGFLPAPGGFAVFNGAGYSSSDEET